MISNFEYYMKVEKKLGHNSCMKYMGNLKKVLMICIKNNWLKKNPFIGYQLVRKPVVVDYLSMEEIEALAKAKLKQVTHHQVRDIFLFRCYTGLAYANVLKLPLRNTDRAGWPYLVVYPAAENWHARACSTASYLL